MLSKQLSSTFGPFVRAAFGAVILTACRSAEPAADPAYLTSGPIIGIDRDVDVRPPESDTYYYVRVEPQIQKGLPKKLVLHVTPNSSVSGLIQPSAIATDGGARLHRINDDYRYEPWRAEITKLDDHSMRVVLTRRSKSAPSVSDVYSIPATRTDLADLGPQKLQDDGTTCVFQARLDGMLFQFSITAK